MSARVGVRSADWVVLAQPLYEADVAGVVGARAWADLPPDEQLDWFARAEDRAARIYLMTALEALDVVTHPADHHEFEIRLARRVVAEHRRQVDAVADEWLARGGAL